MSKIHNFSAGPAILPQKALDACQEALVNFSNTGLSLIEVSHRSKEFVAVMDEARNLMKEILALGADYEILFLQGGASTQFYTVPYNLLNLKAAYINTGTWANKAIKEAKLFGETLVIASSEDKNYNYIPKGFDIPNDIDYLHFTSNNTISGTQFHGFPKTDAPLVCDMSSDILSRRFDAQQFDLIYAGAQKNLGPAGTTIVIIKKDILGKLERSIPTMIDYRTHIKKESMFNTPPVFAIFGVLQTLKWIKNSGGLEAMEKRNKEKAEKLYHAIDSNPYFEGPVAKEDRSWMNATFVAKDENDTELFLKACQEAKISGIKGHRSVGGFRASMYNALELSSVNALINVMNTFK